MHEHGVLKPNIVQHTVGHTHDNGITEMFYVWNLIIQYVIVICTYIVCGLCFITCYITQMTFFFDFFPDMKFYSLHLPHSKINFY